MVCAESFLAAFFMASRESVLSGVLSPDDEVWSDISWEGQKGM